MNFETELNRLREMANRMSGGSLPLEESLKLYEESKKLAVELKEYIKNAKLVIEKEEA